MFGVAPHVRADGVLALLLSSKFIFNCFITRRVLLFNVLLQQFPTVLRRFVSHHHQPLRQPSAKPQWLQAIFDDKRTYFDQVAHVEKCFLTGVKMDPVRQCFSFEFDKAPKNEHRVVQTSFLALRESCRCPQCFAANPQQRVHNLIDLNLAEQPRQINFDVENQILHVDWASNGHRSAYSGPWLYATFTPHPLYEKPAKKLWTAVEFAKKLPTFDFEEICQQPEAMLTCLTSLASYGLVKVTNAPAATGTLAQLSRYMNYIKKTHYGEVFQVENKPHVTNVAYAHGKLTQHTDLPYFAYFPGIQFLHCVRQSKQGGESTFADGFAVAEKLRIENAKAFRILSETKVHAYNCTNDYSDGFLMQKLSPIIVNNDESLKRIAFSNPTFDSLRDLQPVEQQQQYLASLQAFMKLMETKQFRLVTKLNPGEIAIFDNSRVTHGRQAFDPSEPRLFEGMYIDWDEVESRMRIIQSNIFRQKLENYFKF